MQEVEEEEEEEGGGDKLSSQEIKYWSAVKENPSDFSSWTQLLQLVEQKVGAVNYHVCVVHGRPKTRGEREGEGE